MPNMPFEPFHFAPIFAADECSFWALSNVVCWQQADIDNICNADFTPLNESRRKGFFVHLLQAYYPSIAVSEEHRIDTGYTRYKGRIDLVMFFINSPVTILIDTGEEG